MVCEFACAVGEPWTSMNAPPGVPPRKTRKRKSPVPIRKGAFVDDAGIEPATR